MNPTSPAPVPAADFGTRFAAFVIDASVLFVAQWIVFIVVARQFQAVGLTSTEACVPDGVAMCEGPSSPLWALLLLVFVATTIGYHAVAEGRYGTTPGKHWMGLAVVSESGAFPIGHTAGLLRSVVRQLFWLSPLFLFDASPLSLGLPSALFVIVPALALLSFFVGAFRVDGRAGHDLAARTVVVRAEHVAANNSRSNHRTRSTSDSSDPDLSLRRTVATHDSEVAE